MWNVRWLGATPRRIRTIVPRLGSSLDQWNDHHAKKKGRCYESVDVRHVPSSFLWVFVESDHCCCLKSPRSGISDVLKLAGSREHLEDELASDLDASRSFL